ncbi:MAG: sn-glycerol-3-phosphate ABC transporter ATP-binding protein UgpC [Mycobacterium sp.]
MASVTFAQATRIHPGADRPSVNGLDLEIEDGEFVVLVGPSGCGKSTSLRMVAGLDEVHGGQILLDGADITGLAPKRRDIAMVFQNYALYPHMSVADNMAYALKIAGVGKSERMTKVAEVAKLLDLEPYLGRKPKALSGGQRQRVAMGRAIVREPQAFLMDEPLSNLDAKLRVATRAQIASLQRRLGTTTLYVTHDQTEALTMGDRIAVLKDGTLQQFDTPRAMYDAPANTFVASFIGSPQMNLFEATLIEGRALVAGHEFPVERALLAAAARAGDATVTVGVRPEDLVPTADGLPVRVLTIEDLGTDAYVYGRIEGSAHAGPDSGVDISFRVDSRHPPARDTVVAVAPKPARVHAFSGSTGIRL